MAFLDVEILTKDGSLNFHELVSNAHFWLGSPDLKGIKCFDQLFATIIHSPKPTFWLSFSEKRKKNSRLK